MVEGYNAKSGKFTGVAEVVRALVGVCRYSFKNIALMILIDLPKEFLQAINPFKSWMGTKHRNTQFNNSQEKGYSLKNAEVAAI